jgi:PKD repeat protein
LIAVGVLFTAGAGLGQKAIPEQALARAVRGAEAIQALGDKLPAVARQHGLGVEALRNKLIHEPSLWVDPGLRLFYVCEGLAPDRAEAAAADATPPPAVVVPEDPFRLHSRPGASRVIYLDFDGHVVSGTYWNNYNDGQDIDCSAYDIDGDPTTFNDTERQRIAQIFERVAEDYIPYDVDVTTEDPGVEALRKTSASDTQFGVRVVVTPYWQWYGSAGGVAYVGSFDWSTDTPCFCFSSNLANSEKYIGEAASHEAGHTLGLYHDGQDPTTEYYQGHGNWAPIMGVGYYRDITQWSKGEYAGANNQEDDLAIMTLNGIDFRVDDYGDGQGDATALQGTTSFYIEGIIERTGDVDSFTFLTGAGPVAVNAYPAGHGPNLDIGLELYDGGGALVATADPAGLPANLSLTLAAGTYTILLSGVGTGDPSTGYSDYGSLGQYALTGSIVDPGLKTPPTAVAAAAPTSGQEPLPVQFDGSGSTDADGAIVAYAWDFGDGATATGIAVSHTYAAAGSYTATLTVTDNDGLTDSDQVAITVQLPPNTPPVAAATADPATGIAPLTVQFDGTGSYDPDGTITAYAWDFGDGATGSGAAPAHTYDWPGSYPAVLTVTDDRGATDTASVVITVQQDPAMRLYVGAIDMAMVQVPGGSAAQASVRINNGGGGGQAGATVYGEWSGLVNGAVTGVTGSDGRVVFESRKTKKSGTITFTVTGVSAPGYEYVPALNLETSDSISTDTPANQPPVARVSADPTTGTPPLTVQFDGSASSDPDGTVTAYAWDFGDGATATGVAATHTYADAGIYEAVLTVTDNEGATDAASQTITVTSGEVLAVYVADIAMSAGPVPGGAAATAVVTVRDENGAPVAGATVSGDWTGPKATSQQAVTDGAGTAAFTSQKARGSFTYTFTVTDVTVAGGVYDPARNVETTDSISYP